MISGELYRQRPPLELGYFTATSSIGIFHVDFQDLSNNEWRGGPLDKLEMGNRDSQSQFQKAIQNSKFNVLGEFAESKILIQKSEKTTIFSLATLFFSYFEEIKRAQ